MIPACTFDCLRCGACEASASEEGNGGGEEGDGAGCERRKEDFGAVTADGQMASVAQNKIAPVLRPIVEAPAADIPIEFACVISSKQ